MAMSGHTPSALNDAAAGQPSILDYANARTEQAWARQTKPKHPGDGDRAECLTVGLCGGRPEGGSGFSTSIIGTKRKPLEDPPPSFGNGYVNPLGTCLDIVTGGGRGGGQDDGPTKQRLRFCGVGGGAAAAAQDGYSNNGSHNDGDRHAHRHSHDRGYGDGAQWPDSMPYGGGGAEEVEEPRRMSAKTPAGAVSGAGAGVGAWGGTPSTGEAASWERAALEAEEAYRRRLERESKAEEPLIGEGLTNAGGGAGSRPPGHDGGVGVKMEVDAVRRVVIVADASVCVDKDEVTSPNRGGATMPGQGQGQRQGQRQGLGMVAGLGPRSGSVGGDVAVSGGGNFGGGRHEARVSYPAPRNISFGGAVGPSPRQQQQQQLHEPPPQQHRRRQSEQLGQLPSPRQTLAKATAAAPVAAERDVNRKTDAAAMGEAKDDPLLLLAPPLVAQKRESSSLLHPSPHQHHHQHRHPAGAAAAGAVAGATLALLQAAPRLLPSGPRGPPLESLGLPHPLVQYYLVEKKISHLYPWQAECLSLDGVSDHRSNLVYCAPTSGGKSLVAEVLLVKRLIAGLGSGAAGVSERGGSSGEGGALGLMILPFVTLCHERAEELTKMLKPLNIEVRRFYGGQGGKLPPAGGNSGGLIVATPEKANHLVTQLIEEERVQELAVVVVDELHMVQDPHRGATLELMLTKLLFAAGKASHLAGGDGGGGDGDGAGARGGDGSPSASALQQQQQQLQQPVHDHLIPLSADSGGSDPSQLRRRPLPLQIIGMSATLPNVDGLARWLNDAQLYETDYRPVLREARFFRRRHYSSELSVFVKKGREVHAVKAFAAEDDEKDDGSFRFPTSSLLKFERELGEGADVDHVLELARETVEKQDGGVIIFCATKRQCEIVAATLARKLPAGIATGARAMGEGGLGARGLAEGTGGGLGVGVGGGGAQKKPPQSQAQNPAATLAELVEQLRRVKSSSDVADERSLASCVSKGVAWHNAGLHPEEKAQVELAFRSGLVRVMCCTSTMAAGVNLPASRVIIMSPYWYRPNPELHELLPSRELLQMVGRAGRAGLSDKGEAFVVCPKPTEIKWDFLHGGGGGAAGGAAAAAPAASAAVSGAASSSSAHVAVKRDLDAVAMELTKRLTSRGDALSSTIAAAGMRRVMLEAVACGLTQTPADIKRYIQCTLLNALNDFQDVVAKGATEALKWLQFHGFLAWDKASSMWQPQPLGRAAASTHLDPLGATAVIEDVRKARRCLILESDLHLLFLCVPPDPPAAIDVEAAENKTMQRPNVAKREVLRNPAAAPSNAPPPAAAAAAAVSTTATTTAAALPTAGTGPQRTSAPPGAAAKESACWLKPHIFTRIYHKLSPHEHHVAQAVGVTESYAVRLERGKRDASPEHRALRRVCHRFLQALMLHDVISERDEEQIAKDFGLVGSNAISRLQESASRYAAQVAAVCGPMGWGDMEVLVTRLQDRITAGAQEEILCLTAIPMIGAARARALYNAGYRTPEAIVRIASAAKLAKVLESCRGTSKGGEFRAAQIILRGAKVLCEEQRRAAREESEAKLRELEQLPMIVDGEDDAVEDDKDGDVANCGGEVGGGAAAAALDILAARGTMVVRDPAALEILAAHWRGAASYAFCLQPGTHNTSSSCADGSSCVAPPELGQGPASRPPAGIALAFSSNPRATFYAPIINFASTAAAGAPKKEEQRQQQRQQREEKEEEEAVMDEVDGNGRRRRRAGTSKRGFPWEVVRDILAMKGPRKVTVDLKPQLRAMGAAAAAAAAATAPASSSSRRRAVDVGTVAGPVVDVRIAGWLLHPDADELHCGVGTGWCKIVDSLGDKSGPAETLLRFFGAEVDVAGVRAASEWPLGQGPRLFIKR